MNNDQKTEKNIPGAFATSAGIVPEAAPLLVRIKNYLVDCLRSIGNEKLP